MAYLNQTHGATQHSGFGDFVARIRNMLEQRRLYRQTIAELGTLNDRELADLQLNRSMITSAAREAVYGN